MGQHSPRRLTEGYINGLKYDGRGFLVRDTRVVGLMVAVNKLGKSYKVQRDLWQGRRGRRKLVKTVRQTLGCTEELTLDEARLRAEEVLRQIKLGIDPNAPPEVEKSEGWTVKQLYDEYAADMRKRECSEFTIDRVLYRRDLYLADWLTLPLKDLTRSIVRAKHHSLSEDRG
ncbi:MAG: integrase arm-type DNA-binding domain-containing protein, partial [Pseudomonadota bacterium]